MYLYCLCWQQLTAVDFIIPPMVHCRRHSKYKSVGCKYITGIGLLVGKYISMFLYLTELAGAILAVSLTINKGVKGDIQTQKNFNNET